MAYMITLECINCSACLYECPVRAITRGDSQFRIDASTCIECDGIFAAQRCKAVCPVGACVPQRDGYLAKARALEARGAPPVVLRAQQ